MHNSVEVAQAALDKTTKLTFPAMRAQLFQVFSEAGVQLCAENLRVLAVSGEAALVFQEIYGALSSPTVKVAFKRVMASKGVVI